MSPVVTAHIPAIGTARLARKFLAAAVKVQGPARSEREALAQQNSLVAYYLAGHAIELALKTFLLARGVSSHDLRDRKYGHKLDAILKECRRRRMGAVVKLSESELRTIRLLNDTYSAKELEYLYKGTRTLPRYATVLDLAKRLCEGMYAYVAARG